MSDTLEEWWQEYLGGAGKDGPAFTIARDAWFAAVETAAQVCDGRFDPTDALCTREAKHCAAAIRKLADGN